MYPHREMYFSLRVCNFAHVRYLLEADFPACAHFSVQFPAIFRAFTFPLFKGHEVPHVHPSNEQVEPRLQTGRATLATQQLDGEIARCSEDTVIEIWIADKMVSYRNGPAKTHSSDGITA